MKGPKQVGPFWAMAAFAHFLCVHPADAAARGNYGGTLRIAFTGSEAQVEPSLADAPADAALFQTSFQGLCRLQSGDKLQPVLATKMEQAGPRTWRISLVEGARMRSAGALTAHHLAQSWARLSQQGTLSPYRALLYPLRGEGRQLEGAILSSSLIELSTAFPWPDLPASLCHPALAIAVPIAGGGAVGLGPFTSTSRGDVLEENLSFPLGRPYLDRLKIVFANGRRALRLLSLAQVDLVLGEAEKTNLIRSPLELYATYLAFKAERTGADFRGDFEGAVDRAQLTQFFAPTASVPMFNLLPPALMPQSATAVSPASKRRAAPPLTLLYDQALPEQRLVAERIQVRLHDLGYRIALKPVSRSELRKRWALGQFDLMLHAVLMPPLPAPALALAIELAGKHELLASELPRIGAEAEAAVRELKVRERALALAAQLPLIPLYAQSAVLSASPRWYLPFDGQGLPRFDDAYAVGE